MTVLHPGEVLLVRNPNESRQKDGRFHPPLNVFVVHYSDELAQTKLIQTTWSVAEALAPEKLKVAAKQLDRIRNEEYERKMQKALIEQIYAEPAPSTGIQLTDSDRT